MQKRKNTNLTSSLILVLASSFLIGNTAWSQETEKSETKKETASAEQTHIDTLYIWEEVVVVGSRHAPRSVKESAAPIDVLNAEELRTQAAVDMDDILRTLTPSYNIQRHGIDDEATLVRPATLRGLPPDNLLVLVNGKRRHRSGVIALLGSSLNTGSQGPDLSVIPTIAIEQMEPPARRGCRAIRLRRHRWRAQHEIARSIQRRTAGNAGRTVLRGRRSPAPNRRQYRPAALSGRFFQPQRRIPPERPNHTQRPARQRRSTEIQRLSRQEPGTDLGQPRHRRRVEHLLQRWDQPRQWHRSI